MACKKFMVSMTPKAYKIIVRRARSLYAGNRSMAIQTLILEQEQRQLERIEKGKER